MPSTLLVGMDWFPDVVDGGLNRYFFELMNELVVSGSSVTALVAHAGDTRGLPVRSMAPAGAGLLQRLRGSSREARNALKSGVELVNSHFALYAYPLSRSLPRTVPLVVNFQGPWADEMVTESATFRTRLAARVARRIELRVYRRANRVITLSHSFAEIISRRYGVEPSRVRVIPGAADLRAYLAAPERVDARARLSWPEDRPILFTVRRLARRMGLEALIEAMAVVRQSHPKALLLIGGKGPLLPVLASLIERHNLQDHVRLLGFIPEADLPAAYAAADFSVVPTQSLEGFGLVTAEALASGTPVLGTRIGGTPEILEPLASDLLFDAATPTAFADRIDQALRGVLSIPDRAACRQYALRYDWSEVLPRIQEVFRDAGSD